MQKLLLIVLFQAALAGEHFTQRVPYKGMLKSGGKTYTQGSARHRAGDFEEGVSKYLSYGEISEKLLNLTLIVDPKTGLALALLENIGKTYEKRDVYMLKISSNHSAGKPVVVLEAGMHGREWTAPATVLFLAEQLTRNFTSNQAVLDDVDYYIIPVANPDGYEYSRNVNRLWRKTRAPYGDCFGADGNRNFDFHWSESGVSPSSCDDTYPGSEPFSEVEARNLRDLGIKYGKRILVYVSVHCDGSYLLYPFGYSQELPQNWKKLDECAAEFVGAVKRFSGTEYQYGSSGQLLYEAAGGSDDWFLGVVGVPFSYTIELPDSYAEGFHLKPSKISRIGQETLVGFRALVSCAFGR